MPSLPSADQLGRRSFQDRSQVVRPSVDMSGQQQLVDTAQQVSRNINDRLDQSSLYKAKLQFQRKKLEADNAFNEDPDFETYQSRYDEMMGKAVEESAKLVRNPRMQEAFREEISLYHAEGSQAMANKAFGREVDQGIANLDETLTLARENYLRATSPQDRAFARETMMDAINQAQENTYIDADKAQTLRKNAAVDLAIASVNIESPEKQIKLLKENKGLIDVIPKDTRLKMIEQAESQHQSDQALNYANEIAASGGDRGERLKAAEDIKDAEIREMTKRQVEVDFNREERAKNELHSNHFNEARNANIDDGVSILEWKQQNPDKWNAMNPDQKQALLSGSVRQTTNIDVYNNLNRLAETDRDKAYDYYLKNVDQLTSADAKKWSDRLNSPEELDAFLSNSQQLDAALSAIGIKGKKDKKYRDAQEQLNSDYIQFQQDKGRKPDAQELDKLIKGVTETVVDGWFSNTYGFELTPEERSERRESRDDQARDQRFQKILQDYKTERMGKSGIPIVLSDEEIKKIYREADRLGMLDG